MKGDFARADALGSATKDGARAEEGDAEGSEWMTFIGWHRLALMG